MAPRPTPMEPPRLPVDVLLEIFALVDVKTAIRCAATSTLLRNAILDPGFSHRLRRRAAAGPRGVGYDPARLLAVSYSSPDYGGDGVVHLRRPRRARFDAGLLRSFDAVSSRDGLLVLFRDKPDEPKQMRVCNALTGVVTELPHMDVLDHQSYGGIYRPALLAVGAAAAASFELLVMDVHLRVQTFSSSNGGGGACGAVREVAPPPGHQRLKPYALQTSPAVIGRAVHYLCNSRSELQLRPGDDMFVLAVHADEASAAAIELPEGWLCPDGDVAAESCNLAVTAEGRLSVLVADPEAGRVWAMSPETEEAGWSRRATIDRRRIGEQVAPAGVKAVGMAVLPRGCGERDRRKYQYERAWLHEVDLASLLQGMKAMIGIGDKEDDEEEEDDEDEEDDDNEEEEGDDDDDDW